MKLPQYLLMTNFWHHHTVTPHHTSIFQGDLIFLPLVGNQGLISSTASTERMRSATLDSTVSRAVQALICVVVLGGDCKFSNSNAVSPGIGTSVGASGKGRRLNRSVLPFCAPGLYAMV